MGGEPATVAQLRSLAMAEPATGASHRNRWIDACLVLALLSLSAPILRPWSTQYAPRYLMTAAAGFAAGALRLARGTVDADVPDQLSVSAS